MYTLFVMAVVFMVALVMAVVFMAVVLMAGVEEDDEECDGCE